MIKPFLDYYRCPSEFARFGTTGELSREEGYFKFDGVICYGRRRSGSLQQDVTADLDDVRCEVEHHAGHVRLPFHLSEVITNLQMERYASCHRNGQSRNGTARFVRDAYYFVRPILPVRVRRHMQRAHLSGWEKIPFPRWPVDFSVDTLVQKSLGLLLRDTGIDRVPFIWFWPDGFRSCAIMTHDVESEAGRDFCGDLMDIDDSYQIKSSFQLVPEARYEVSEELCQDMRNRGFEVNVHDLIHDGYLFQSEREFPERAAKINAYARKFQSAGFRAGAMYRNQGWYGAFEFSYDMSVPNVAHLEPQRGGCCTVMPYFVGNVLELPLTATQDYSLFHIIGDYSAGLWKRQIELIKGRNGLVSFITHPDYLIERRARAVYQELLAHLAQLARRGEIWIPLPGEVDRWWRARNQMTLVCEAGAWRVKGDPSGRARVAFATLQNDQCVYQLSDTTAVSA
jgi:hypothetical protein